MGSLPQMRMAVNFHSLPCLTQMSERRKRASDATIFTSSSVDNAAPRQREISNFKAIQTESGGAKRPHTQRLQNAGSSAREHFYSQVLRSSVYGCENCRNTIVCVHLKYSLVQEKAKHERLPLANQLLYVANLEHASLRVEGDFRSRISGSGANAQSNSAGIGATKTYLQFEAIAL